MPVRMGVGGKHLHISKCEMTSEGILARATETPVETGRRRLGDGSRVETLPQQARSPLDPVVALGVSKKWSEAHSANAKDGIQEIHQPAPVRHFHEEQTPAALNSHE